MNGLALAGLICGIASLLSGVPAVFAPAVTVLLFLASIAAIILGSVAMYKTKKAYGTVSTMSVIALVTGVLGLFFGLLYSLPVAVCSCLCAGFNEAGGISGMYGCAKDIADDIASNIEANSNIGQFFN